MNLPKPTDLLSPIADTESSLKNQIESTTGLALPPGPIEMVKSVIEQLEDTIPELPSLESISLPFGGGNFNVSSPQTSAGVSNVKEETYTSKKSKSSTSRKLLW